MEQSPLRDAASGLVSSEVKRKSSIQAESVDVKKAGKKQKTEVDTDYTYGDDDTDSDSDSTETLVGEEEEEEDGEIDPQLNWFLTRNYIIYTTCRDGQLYRLWTNDSVSMLVTMYTY